MPAKLIIVGSKERTEEEKFYDIREPKEPAVLIFTTPNTSPFVPLGRRREALKRDIRKDGFCIIL